jgi:hypothetical protein
LKIIENFYQQAFLKLVVTDPILTKSTYKITPKNIGQNQNFPTALDG